VNWTLAAGDAVFASYLLQASVDHGAFVSETGAYTDAALASHTFTGLESNASYVFRVTASSDLEHAVGTVEQTTHRTVALPTGWSTPFTTTDTTVDLAWTDSVENDNDVPTVQYRIEQSVDELTWVEVATVAADTSTYQVTGLDSNTTHYFRVVKVNDVEGYDEVVSVTESVTTLQTLAMAAVWTTPFTTTETSVELMWTDGPHSLALDGSLFDSANASRDSYDTATEILTISGGMNHILSTQTYKLPVFVECELTPNTGDTALLLDNSLSGSGTNKKLSAGSVVWGTGAVGTSNLVWGVNGSKADNVVDPTRSKFNKFSIYVDAYDIIMYQYDGVERYRFTSDSHSFPDWAVVDGTVRVGLWAWSHGQFRNFKVSENVTTNPWTVLPHSLIIESATFQRSSTSRISFNTASGVISASDRSHMLSNQDYALPLYVECELKTTNNSAALMLGNDIHNTDITLNNDTTSVKNNVCWLTSTYEETLGLYIKDNTGLLQTPFTRYGDPNSAKANYRRFSLYVSKDAIVAYIDDNERYRYVSESTSFPNWAVEGGRVRIGVYQTSDGAKYRNLKVYENPTPFTVGYLLQHSPDQISWTDVALGADVRAHTVDGLTAETEYHFRMYSQNVIEGYDDVVSDVTTLFTPELTYEILVKLGTGVWANSSVLDFDQIILRDSDGAIVEYDVTVNTDLALHGDTDPGVDNYAYPTNPLHTPWNDDGNIRTGRVIYLSGLGNSPVAGDMLFTLVPHRTASSLEVTHYGDRLGPLVIEYMNSTYELSEGVLNFAVESATTTRSYYPSTIMAYIKTEFKSSNRDFENDKVLISLRIAPSDPVSIVSRCSASRIANYETDTTLFDDGQKNGLAHFDTLGAHDIVFETPHAFSPGDETTSQWVYYRFLDSTNDDSGSQVFELEVEDHYRYGWVAASSGWQKYFMTTLSLTVRNGLYIFAHENDTAVKVTDLSGSVTTINLDKWETTLSTPGLLSEAVSVRATKPIQLGGDLHNEQVYIDVSIRDTKFIIPNHMYNNTHDEHIYVHHDNTTVSLTTMADYENGVAPKTITYASKGLYSIRWGTATSLSDTSYEQYHTLMSGGTSGDKSTTGKRSHVLWSDKPISGISASQAGVQAVAWIPPTNTKAFTLRWKFIQHNGWWCFDDPSKYAGTSMQFKVIHRGTSSSSPSHTVTLGEYSVTKNWSGTSSAKEYAIQLQDSSLTDVFFSAYTFADGSGRDSGMSFSPKYASTAYAQVLDVSGGDADPMYVFSLNDGVQSVETITLDPATRQQTSATSTSYDFTHNYNLFGVATRFFGNVSTNSNKVYRTSADETFLGPYVNTNGNREGWKTGNIPHVRDLIFTPLPNGI
jgi:hypothetical protein